MKKILIINLLITLALMTSTTKSQIATNDFYDDAETFILNGSLKIELTGEIANPEIKDISQLPERSLIIKEAVLSGDSNRFIGAYRYDGYSLYDILNYVILKKKNEAEFPPIIDLYVEVTNNEGESVILSWGEIYYPVHRHEIIIATKVTRIVPSKTKDLWPLPSETRLIVGTDLITERNISNPVKITVFSANANYVINKGMSPLHSEMIKIFYLDNFLSEFNKTTDFSVLSKQNYETVFYGRGRGIHSTTPFHGYLLKDVLGDFFKATPDLLKNGYFIVASVDGYRSVYTYSEIFNRNDQAELLIVPDPENQDGGAFRLFPAGDFFSDRAVKAVSEIRLIF